MEINLNYNKIPFLLRNVGRIEAVTILWKCMMRDVTAEGISINYPASSNPKTAISMHIKVLKTILKSR
jgi:hypothetical protein